MAVGDPPPCLRPPRGDTLPEHDAAGAAIESGCPLQFVPEPNRLAPDVVGECRMNDALDLASADSLFGCRLEVDDAVGCLHRRVVGGPAAGACLKLAERLASSIGGPDERLFVRVE